MHVGLPSAVISFGSLKAGHQEAGCSCKLSYPHLYSLVTLQSLISLSNHVGVYMRRAPNLEILGHRPLLGWRNGLAYIGIPENWEHSWCLVSSDGVDEP